MCTYLLSCLHAACRVEVEGRVLIFWVAVPGIFYRTFIVPTGCSYIIILSGIVPGLEFY